MVRSPAEDRGNLVLSLLCLWTSAAKSPRRPDAVGTPRDDAQGAFPHARYGGDTGVRSTNTIILELRMNTNLTVSPQMAAQHQ